MMVRNVWPVYDDGAMSAQGTKMVRNVWPV